MIVLPFTSSFPVLVTARYTLQQPFVYVFAVVQGDKVSQIQPCEMRGEVPLCPPTLSCVCKELAKSEHECKIYT